MNHFSYESMAKDRVKELRKEGMRSQAFHRAGARKTVLLGGLSKLILTLLGILGMLGLLVR